MKIKHLIKIILLGFLLFSNAVFAISDPASTKLELMNQYPGKSLNWVFVSDGKSTKQKSYREAVASIKLPGKVWFLNWSSGKSNLEDAIKGLKNVVLVTHSESGRLALASPQLEKYLSGLVLMDTTPEKAKWIPNHFPVLILSGSEDKIASLQAFENDKRFFNNKNVTITVINGGSESPWVGHKEEFNTALNNFSMEVA